MEGEDSGEYSVSCSEVFDAVYKPYMFLKSWDSENPLLDFARPTEALWRLWQGIRPKEGEEVGMGFFPDEYLVNERLNKIPKSPNEALLFFMDDYSAQLEEEGVTKMYLEGAKHLDSFAVYLMKNNPESQFFVPLNFDHRGVVRSLDLDKAMQLLEMTPADPRDEIYSFLTFEENVFLRFYLEMRGECIEVDRRKNEESSKLLSILNQTKDKK
jgi:hypothetical protein